MTKAVRYVDNQGRVIIPSHIRKALNVAPGVPLEMELDDTGSIRIRASVERCAVCGKPVQDKPRTDVKTKTGKKSVCYECAQAIARGMIAQMR